MLQLSQRYLDLNRSSMEHPHIYQRERSESQDQLQSYVTSPPAVWWEQRRLEENHGGILDSYNSWLGMWRGDVVVRSIMAAEVETTWNRRWRTSNFGWKFLRLFFLAKIIIDSTYVHMIPHSSKQWGSIFSNQFVPTHDCHDPWETNQRNQGNLSI